MSEDEAVRIDTRLAGQLRRYHTWPIIGQQTVAEHTWQVIRIYMCVVEKIDPVFLTYIQFHDVGEHAVGDLPYPVKRDNHALKEQTEMLEQRSLATQLDYWDSALLVSIHSLSEADKKFFKQIEIMEMAEFGLDQICLGNSHGFVIADRCLHSVYDSAPCHRLIEYAIKRLELFFNQCHLVLNESELDLGVWWFPTEWRKIDESK